METATPSTTYLFFQYLREANWRTRPWRLAIGQPGRELFDFIIGHNLPIYLGSLHPNHHAMEIGLWPHLGPLSATVSPDDDQAMAAMLRLQGCELVPPHLLGTTIVTRRRPWSGNKRQYAQLGIVMVRRNNLTSWHRTNFVFAAEIDEYGRAAVLWMMEQLEAPLPELLPYPPFDLHTIAFVPPSQQPQLLLELYCGQAGWRHRSEAVWYEGLGLVALDTEMSPKPVHFVRVAQNWTGDFMHATSVQMNPTATGSRPIWVCSSCEEPHWANCPEMNQWLKYPVSG